MGDYRKLKVWEKSEELAVTVYAFAGDAEEAGHTELSDQMKRSAGSIAKHR